MLVDNDGYYNNTIFNVVSNENNIPILLYCMYTDVRGLWSVHVANYWFPGIRGKMCMQCTSWFSLILWISYVYLIYYRHCYFYYSCYKLRVRRAMLSIAFMLHPYAYTRDIITYDACVLQLYNVILRYWLIHNILQCVSNSNSIRYTRE